MNIGVLALQGAFIEHQSMLESLGASVIQIRQLDDLEKNQIDGLVLPGGESTVQGKLLHALQLFEPLKKKIEDGCPVLATCAGMILLSKSISNDDHTHLATMPIKVKRNAYGRQLGSFITTEPMSGVGDIEMHFIRAPYIEEVGDSVDVLATVDDHIVAAQYKNQIALSFHPEVGTDTRTHEYFLELVQKKIMHK